MHVEHLVSSRLFGLIGESARLLPASAVESLELMLSMRESAPVDPSIPCPSLRLPRSRGMAAYAYREREALSAILEILHAAQQEQDAGESGSLDGRLIEGLLVAGRLIVEFGE